MPFSSSCATIHARKTERTYPSHGTWAVVLSGPTRHRDTWPGVRLLEKGAEDRSSPHLIPQLFAPHCLFLFPKHPVTILSRESRISLSWLVPKIFHSSVTLNF
jgi:hypothetical protein